MQIYFAGSVRGGRQDRAIYQAIITHLQQYGTVLTEHLALPDLGDSAMSDREIWEMDMNWLDEADIMVAEISQPSIGVGYEIGRAEQLGKKIVVLHRKDAHHRVSAMVAGNPDIAIYEYSTIGEAKHHIDEIFAKA